MNDSPTNSLTFEQALAELERIVRELEDGQTGLDDALTRYEAGISLLKRCYGQLRAAEQRILELTGVGADGQPLSRPFEHTAAVEAEKAEAKRRQRKRGEDGPQFEFSQGS